MDNGNIPAVYDKLGNSHNRNAEVIVRFASRTGKNIESGA